MGQTDKLSAAFLRMIIRGLRESLAEDAPPKMRFGPWQSVYSRFRAWTKAGVWERILSAQIEQDLADETALMLDNTTVKVHQHASGAQKGDTAKKPGGAGVV